MKKTHFILICVISLFFLSCNSKEEIKKWPDVGDLYDSSKPISLDALLPNWGVIDQTFVIKGNFPRDTSKIEVFFADRKSVVLNCDGNTIVGMVPKQLPGNNPVKVVIAGETYNLNETFKYYQTQLVKTIVGKFDYGDIMYQAGPFAEAYIERPSGLGIVKGQKGDNVVVVEGEWIGRISLLSMDDNTMIELSGPGWCGGPAVTSTKDKFYVIGRDGDRRVYSFAREDGWLMTPLGDLVIPSSIPGKIIGGLTFAEDDKYLYALSPDGYFLEIDVEDQYYNLLLDKSDFQNAGMNIGSDRWWGQLMYSKYHKCFFAAFQDEHVISKIYKQDGTWIVERYAGGNGAGMSMGHRLNDAKFNSPVNIAENENGELYVVCRYGHSIVKISGNMVSLVAGSPGNPGKLNGYPLDARFDQPISIVADSEYNFYIGEYYNHVIRKMTIE